MKFGLDETTLQSIKRVFVHFPEVSEVIVYGSRAKGNFRPGSDIDLAIKGEQLDLQTLNRLRAALHELATPYTFDLCIYANIKNTELIEHIDRVGRPFLA